MSNYTIRRAREEDLGRIKELLFQVNNVHAIPRKDLFKVDGIKYDDASLQQLLSNEDVLIWVAIKDDTVYGYGICQIEYTQETTSLVANKTLYIDDICVDSVSRGYGIGEQIFNTIRDYAAAEDYDYITLNVWECNPGARAFYEKMGLLPRKTMMEMKL